MKHGEWVSKNYLSRIGGHVSISNHHPQYSDESMTPQSIVDAIANNMDSAEYNSYPIRPKRSSMVKIDQKSEINNYSNQGYRLLSRQRDGWSESSL